jgi:hypothetical protein
MTDAPSGSNRNNDREKDERIRVLDPNETREV